MFRLPRPALVTTLVSSLILSLALAGSVMAGDRSFSATLTDEAELDGGDANAAASGSFAMTLDYGHRTICYTLSWANLSAGAAAAHIHVGTADVNGGIVVPLSVQSPPVASGSTSDCISADRALLHAIVKDPAGYYVNVHTSANPGGAVRGQLAETGG
jgi:hypothetical protein